MIPRSEATSLTKDEIRRWLRAGEMPNNYRERCLIDLEFDSCGNCDDRKCMGCVMRDYDHECRDDCPSCCMEPPVAEEAR